MADNLLKIWDKIVKEDRAWYERGETYRLVEDWLEKTYGVPKSRTPLLSRETFLSYLEPTIPGAWAHALSRIVKDAEHAENSTPPEPTG